MKNDMDSTTILAPNAALSSNKNKLITDMKVVLGDVENLLKSAATASGQAAIDLREEAARRLRLATEKMAEYKDIAIEQGKKAAHAADDYVHENPWRSVGIAAAVGFLVGLVINRK